MPANSLILIGSTHDCLSAPGNPVEPVLALWPAKQRPFSLRNTQIGARQKYAWRPSSDGSPGFSSSATQGS